MNDTYVQLLLFLRSIWLRRWYALGVAWLVAIVGWGYVSTVPDVYQSRARIFIDTETMLKPLMRGLTPEINISQQIGVMQQTLLSRPNIERVVRMSDLDHQAASEAEFEGLVSGVAKDVSLTHEGIDLFQVSFQHPDPLVAKRVVQSLLTIFVESNLGLSRKDLSQARRFIDEQIRDYERQLAEAEARRAQFRRENLGLLPGEENYFQRMQRERGTLTQLNQKLREAELTRDGWLRQLNDTPQYIGEHIAGAGDSYGPQQRLADLERKLTDLDSSGYTEAHPDVISTRLAIEKAREDLREQREVLKKMQMGDLPVEANSMRLNPIYQSIHGEVGRAEAEMSKLQAQIQEKEQMIGELEALAKSVPDIEAQLIRLDRDYDVLKNKYEEMLSRRESARLAQDLEAKSDKVQFRVIEPPELPSRPESPNRPLLLSLCLLVGVGAGLGVAFLMSQIHPTYSTAAALRHSFDLPVLGTISAITFDTQSRRRRVELASFSVGVLGLVVGLFLVLTLQGTGGLI